MMTKHLWSLVCRESKIDLESNNLSIIDAYDSLQFQLTTEERVDPKKQPIGAPINFEILSLYYRVRKGTVQTFDEQIIVLDPDGKELGKFQSTAKFEKEHDRVRSRVKFNMIALSRSGTYIFQVSSNCSGSKELKHHISIPLDVSLKVNDEDL